MSIYNIVASTDEATVVAEYAAEYNVRPEKYQSEAELEREFIRQLTSQGYECERGEINGKVSDDAFPPVRMVIRHEGKPI